MLLPSDVPGGSPGPSRLPEPGAGGPGTEEVQQQRGLWACLWQDGALLAAALCWAVS